MAEGTMNRGASPQNELSLNMKLISQNELDGFGGIGEGMGMHKTKDGRRIMWLGHEGPPKNFTGVDVTDPKNPKVIVQTELPHSKMRSNSLEVIGDLMIVSHQIRGAEPPYKPAGFDDLGHQQTRRAARRSRITTLPARTPTACTACGASTASSFTSLPARRISSRTT